MWNFFYKEKGAISVFLCLILLPTLLIGGMTVDASRIYMSKQVISDAGEMAMNAGLAQYNERLHDEYGMFVMEKSPETISAELEGFFNASLNGSGIPGTEDYKRILHLLEEDFDALGVAGSEIYRTEVEKQQIIEYMKYRAPVCLTELVLEKIKELKDTQKMMDAMNAEIDYSEAMEDCQDAFEKAKNKLDTLEQVMSNYPNQNDIQTELDNTMRDFTEIAARALLMREAIQKYNQYSDDTDIKEVAEKFIESAKKVDLANPCSQVTFDSYMESMSYKNRVEKLGGINKLLNDYNKIPTEIDNPEDSADNENTESSESDERGTLQDIIAQYNQQKERIADYANILLKTANDTVTLHYKALNTYCGKAKTASEAAKQAYKELETVKKKLKTAAEKFDVWDSKTNELKTIGKAGDMSEEVERERGFFSEENAGNLENLEKLMVDVQTNQYYFEEVHDVLEEEKFFNYSIANVPAATQVNKYRAEAENAVTIEADDYSVLESIRKSYISNYKHTRVSTAYVMMRITTDPFYEQLQKYCEKKQMDSQQQQNEANEMLNRSKEAGADADKIENYPKYNWKDAGITLPSTLTGNQKEDSKEALTNLDSDANVNDSRARRNSISKFKDSIQAANSFLKEVDEILTKGLEKLYIAEYAMQMFSYYTIDKKDGQQMKESDILSISGYNLLKHTAYRAEGEYILWSNPESQINVRNTVMMIFGIRLLFNSFFAFTNRTINGTAQSMATAIAGGAQYLIPIIKVVIKFGFAGVETADDVQKIKQGYGVTIFKNASTWKTYRTGSTPGDNTKGVTFDYSEYLRVFLNISMLTGKEVGILGRIADCIQVNQPDINLQTSYTMISVQAKVKAKTTFMRKISDWGSGGKWGFPDDSYSISYQSILGY